MVQNNFFRLIYNTEKKRIELNDNSPEIIHEKKNLKNIQNGMYEGFIYIEKIYNINIEVEDKPDNFELRISLEYESNEKQECNYIGYQMNIEFGKPSKHVNLFQVFDLFCKLRVYCKECESAYHTNKTWKKFEKIIKEKYPESKFKYFDHYSDGIFKCIPLPKGEICWCCFDNFKNRIINSAEQLPNDLLKSFLSMFEKSVDALPHFSKKC